MTYPTCLAFDQNYNLIVGNSQQSKSLIRVDMQTGSQSLITTLTNLNGIQDVDVDSQGRFVVTDFGYSGGGKIIRFDPNTGLQTTIASGGYLNSPSDLLIHPSGDYLVANKLSTGTTQILKIDSSTGAQNVMLTVPGEGWIALQDVNHLYYADFNGNLSILRADLTTGQTQTVAKYSVSGSIVGMAVFSPVPEPSTFVLLGMGVAGIMVLKWGRRRK
jgi:hypothetical protein